MKKLTSYLLFLLFAATLIFGNVTLTNAQQSLQIWFEKLIPSMFLSMVFVRLLYKRQAFHALPLFHIPQLLGMDRGAFHLVLCAMLLGFPTGSTFIDEAIEDGLSPNGAKRLLYCCSFPTPGFVIMSCGLVFFHSLRIGLLLFAAQLLSGLCLLLLSRHDRVVMAPPSDSSVPSFMRCLSSSIIESGIALFMIGGYLMLFMSISAVIFSFLPAASTLFLRCLGEFSSGIVLINQTPIPLLWQMLATCFLLGFAGFCVHMQIMSMVEHVRLHYGIFFTLRIIQGFLSVAIFYALLQFL